MRADVVVIGGGIAGVSVAAELAGSCTVVLLEADRTPPRHATARSAAVYVPGHGGPQVRALIAASGPRFAALAAADPDTPPLLSPRPVIWVGRDAEGAAGIAALVADRAGEPDGPVALDPGEAARRCPALRSDAISAAAIAEGAADVDAIALHACCTRLLRRRGGTLRSGAAVTAIRRERGAWRVQTPDVTVTAQIVVNAAGAWADRVAGLAGVPGLGLVPLRRTIAVARVPDPARLCPPDGGPLPMFIEVGERCYAKAEHDRLLVSPGDETPAEAGDARPEPLDVATALERVDALTGLGLRSVVTSWAGLRTFTPDRRPVIGARPENPDFVFLAGQGGAGIETAPASAALAAAVVRGEGVRGAAFPADFAVDPETLLPR